MLIDMQMKVDLVCNKCETDRKWYSNNDDEYNALTEMDGELDGEDGGEAEGWWFKYDYHGGDHEVLCPDHAKEREGA